MRSNCFRNIATRNSQCSYVALWKTTWKAWWPVQLKYVNLWSMINILLLSRNLTFLIGHSCLYRLCHQCKGASTKFNYIFQNSSSKLDTTCLEIFICGMWVIRLKALLYCNSRKQQLSIILPEKPKWFLTIPRPKTWTKWLPPAYPF